MDSFILNVFLTVKGVILFCLCLVFRPEHGVLWYFSLITCP